MSESIYSLAYDYALQLIGQPLALFYMAQPSALCYKHYYKTANASKQALHDPFSLYNVFYDIKHACVSPCQ